MVWLFEDGVTKPTGVKLTWEYHPGLIPATRIVFALEFNGLLRVVFSNHVLPIYLFVCLFVCFRIPSTWKVTLQQKRAFLSPKKQQGNIWTTRLHTNPSPDSDSGKSLGTLPCKETAPDPFCLIYQTFQIFPKLTSMGRIQISR